MPSGFAGLPYPLMATSSQIDNDLEIVVCFYILILMVLQPISLMHLCGIWKQHLRVAKRPFSMPSKRHEPIGFNSNCLTDESLFSKLFAEQQLLQKSKQQQEQSLLHFLSRAPQTNKGQGELL